MPQTGILNSVQLLAGEEAANILDHPFPVLRHHEVEDVCITQFIRFVAKDVVSGAIEEDQIPFRVGFHDRRR